MNYATIIGLAAALGTTLAFIPQAVKVRKTKKTQDLSLAMYSIFSSGLLLWLVYGLLIKDIPIILANAITLSLACYILAMKIKHG